MTDSGSRSDPLTESAVEVRSSPASMPFDAVVIDDGSTQRNLSPGEFFALPLAERIQHVVQQRASFFVCGQPVDPKAALAHIRRMRTLAFAKTVVAERTSA